MRGKRWLWLAGPLAGLAALGLPLQAEPETAPSPSPRPAFLGRASARRVRAHTAQLPPAGAPSLRTVPTAPGPEMLRFEERLDVAGRSPERAIEEVFAGQDLRHGPTFGSAPTVAESRGPARFDANPESPSLDLLGGAAALVKRLRGSGPPRYYLYEVVPRRGSATLLLREGRLPREALEQPGVSYRELAGFARASQARRALARLEAQQRRSRLARLAHTPPPSP